MTNKIPFKHRFLTQCRLQVRTDPDCSDLTGQTLIYELARMNIRENTEIDKEISSSQGNNARSPSPCKTMLACLQMCGTSKSELTSHKDKKEDDVNVLLKRPPFGAADTGLGSLHPLMVDIEDIAVQEVTERLGREFLHHTVACLLAHPDR